jgi:hypothetical protein
LPAELPPGRREEILDRVYRGGYRLRRIKRFRWASAGLAALLVVVGVPTLLLSSSGSDKTVNAADGATTTLPEGGNGVVTPYNGDGSVNNGDGSAPANGSTSTTAAGHRGAGPTTRPQQGVRLIPAVTLPPVKAPTGHWEPQTSGITQTLRAVSFPDSTHGWAVGDNALLATSDGGAHWAPQTFPFVPTDYNNFMLMGVSFVDSTHGWAVGWGNEIIATTDGGAHWVRQTPPVDPTYSAWTFMAASFVDQQHGWVIGFEGLIATNDGGAHWTEQLQRSQLPNHGDVGYGVPFQDVQHGWAAYYGFAFADTQSGWALGPNGAAVTSDGGASWNAAAIGDKHSFTFGAAVDPQHAWFTAPSQTPDQKGNAIMATADGANWFPQWVGDSVMYGISFPDATVGWSVGSGGAILRYLPD